MRLTKVNVIACDALRTVSQATAPREPSRAFPGRSNGRCITIRMTEKVRAISAGFAGDKSQAWVIRDISSKSLTSVSKRRKIEMHCPDPDQRPSGFVYFCL